jgi:hypothetical protein
MRSYHEIIFRSRQYAWNTIDRWRYILSGSERRSTDKVACEAGIPKFFISSDNHIQLVDILLEKFSSDLDRLRRAADQICRKRFPIFEIRKEFSWGNGDRIDWHFDPVHGKSAPRIWWRKVDCFDFDKIGDPKIIWEINRHQILIFLSKAFLLFRSSKYLDEIFRLWTSWLEANKPKYGINWISSLEMSIRAIAWIWTVHLVSCSAVIPRNLYARMIRVLRLHANHIENNLSEYHSPNTHLTGEALGLFYIGLFLHGDRHASRWVQVGRRILLEQIRRHVLADGGYVERTFWYHRYTLEIYLHFYLLAKRNHIPLPGSVSEDIVRLGEFLMYAAGPDGHFPMIGDDDGGRLIHLDQSDGKDPRGLLGTLAVLFNRGDLKFVAQSYGEMTLWLLGPESIHDYEQLPEHQPDQRSKGFPDTGYFFMRSAWSSGARFLAFDCGPHGWLNCGHAHADLLSFHLQAGSQGIVVDPGTYTYSGPLRDHFRGPDSHATVKVDGKHPAKTGKRFQWIQKPRHQLLNWTVSNKYDMVSGLMTSDLGWDHQRTIFFIKPDFFFIQDVITGNRKHSIELRFPLGIGNWHLTDASCILTDAPGYCSFQLYCPTEFLIDLSDSWLSPCYGNRLASKILLMSTEAELPLKIGTLISFVDRAVKVEMPEDASTLGLRLMDEAEEKMIFNLHHC